MYVNNIINNFCGMYILNQKLKKIFILVSDFSLFSCVVIASSSQWIFSLFFFWSEKYRLCWIREILCASRVAKPYGLQKPRPLFSNTLSLFFSSLKVWLVGRRKNLSLTCVFSTVPVRYVKAVTANTERRNILNCLCIHFIHYATTGYGPSWSLIIITE